MLQGRFRTEDGVARVIGAFHGYVAPSEGSKGAAAAVGGRDRRRGRREARARARGGAAQASHTVAGSASSSIVPATQLMQSPIPDPGLEYVPAAHAIHDVEPAKLYVPFAQKVLHIYLPIDSCHDYNYSFDIHWFGGRN